LRILAKRIIIDTQGKIVDYELNSPFSYLDRIVANLRSISVCRSSEQVALGVLYRSLFHAAPGVHVTWRFFAQAFTLWRRRTRTFAAIDAQGGAQQ
jgi:hypothetical protein